MPLSVSTSDAPCITARSEVLPMITPTTGDAVDSRGGHADTPPSTIACLARGGALPHLGQLGSGGRDVAELPGRPRCLAVAVHGHARHGEGRADGVERIAAVGRPGHVRHAGGGHPQVDDAERHPEDGPHEVLELRRRAGLEGEVSGVVRTHRQLVEEQALIDDEELDGHHPDEADLSRDALASALAASSRFSDVVAGTNASSHWPSRCTVSTAG